MTDADLGAAGASIVLAAGAAVLFGVALSGRLGGRAIAWLAVLVCVGASTVAVANGTTAVVIGVTLAHDGPGAFFGTLIALVTAASLGLAGADRRSARALGAEETALVLMSAAGAALAVAAADLLLLLVGLALLSLPLAVLAARHDARPREPRALRTFLLGATASAIVLYGIALLYAATGETGYAALGRATHNSLYLAGLGLVVAGLASVAALAPAVRWSIVATVASAGALLRLAAATRSGEASLDWEVSLATLGALAIAIGALRAQTEPRLRRLIGDLTIVQLGYVAVAAAGFAAPAAALSIASYAALAVGAFGAIALLPEDDPTVRDLSGLARRRPLVAIAIGIFVLGLVGLPPTVAFVARVYVFEVAVRAQLLWLVIIGAVATVAMAAAGARIVLATLAAAPLDRTVPPRARIGGAVLLALALVVVACGVVPGPLLDAAQEVRF